ncbi:MAG TPA: hypothetical protein VHB46_15010 [Burkholderiales bacterium]|nr:hypothetical protein [Burkholderiales bacterium]
MQKFLSLLIGVVMATCCAMAAWADRTFPQTARRGDMKAFQYPAMKIGDKVLRLSPGSRIFNEQNLLILPVALQKQYAPVMYLLDMQGDLSQVWLLSAEEAKQYPVTK